MRLIRRQGLWWALGVVILLGLGELTLRTRYRQQVLPAGRTKPDAVTIVALGDSITAGWPGPPEQAWPARLEARLRAAYPAAAWRVVNAGVPGETAPMGYARFDRSVAAHAPDLTLIAFGLNDCHRNRHALDRWFEARVPSGPGRSYVWRALQARVARLRRRLGWLAELAPEPTPVPFLRTSPAGFSAALSALVDRTRDIRGQPVLLTMTPMSDQTPPDVRAFLEAYAVYNARIRSVASKRGVPLVELAADASDGAFTVDGLHLTAIGQRWAADRVFETLETVGLWEALARRAR